MSKYRLSMRDDAGEGEPLDFTITDETFAHGPEIQVRRGSEQANIVLDYFNGKLMVRQYSNDGEEQLASMPVVFSEEQPGDE